MKQNQTGVPGNVDTGGNEEYDVDQRDHGIEVGRELLREDLVVDEDGGDEGEDTSAQVPGNRVLHSRSEIHIKTLYDRWAGTERIYYG